MKKIFFMFLLFFGISNVYAGNKEWDTFVDKFQKSEMADSFKESLDSYVFASSDKNLVITVNDNIRTEFIYDDGYVIFKNSNDKKTVFADDFWIANALNTLCEMKGYNPDKVIKYLEDNPNLTLENDGVEYEMKEIREDNGTSHSKITTYSKFNFDLRNGLPHFNETIETPLVENVENPETGVTDNLNLILFLGIGVLGYFNIRKYSKFPLA